MIGLGILLTLAVGSVWGQGSAQTDEDTTSARDAALEKYRELTEPEKKLEERKKRLEKGQEKQRPPFEFFRSQVAPFDVLPYVKANHWSTISLEMRANLDNFSGRLTTAPVRLLEMPHEVVYSRDARLVKEQTGRIALQMMLPNVTKELQLELGREEAVRGDAAWQASLLRLEPQQMLVPVLSPDPAAYVLLSKMLATLPYSGDRGPEMLERQRYYRLVTPQNPEKPSLLSTHPLTWTTISHVLWDGYNPELLSIAQQQAMLDWLHWGGQLVIVGGAGPSLGPLQDSFLGPFLPAIPSGKNVLLTEKDLDGLSRSLPPPMSPGEWEKLTEGDAFAQGAAPPRYKAPMPIRPAPGKSVYLSGLTPLEGAVPIPLGDPGKNLLGVERRIGRGRITMLALKPTDPAFLKWEGIDTFFRQVVLRRPEEGTWAVEKRGYGMLGAPELSWLRITARDLGAPAVSDANASQIATSNEVQPSLAPLGAWLDRAMVPVRAREALEKASGITIPGRNFVLKIVLAYVIALVPLNWLICRFVLRKRELAWTVVPVLALGFAVVVERASAYDLGFDSACDEIDLLELQETYPRGHLSRFSALYSTGRVRYAVSYPDNPTSLALPMNMERGLRGEDVVSSGWESAPVPTLRDFPVQPRSLAMYRAEEMTNLPGAIEFVEKNGKRQVINGLGVELKDAVVIRVGYDERYKLGTIAAGATVELKEPTKPPAQVDPAKAEWITVAKDKSKIAPTDPLLEMLRGQNFGRPEDAGEWRLVAWCEKPHSGQVISPKLDRHRGFRIVLAHMTYGPPPAAMPPASGATVPVASAAADAAPAAQ